MSNILILFPHQLFPIKFLPKNIKNIVLIEEHLFFTQYNFHKQKLLLHRSSMQAYKDLLSKAGLKVTYVAAQDQQHDIRIFIDANKELTEITYFDPVDFNLSKRIALHTAKHNIKTTKLESPNFINTVKDLEEYLASSKKYFHADFYTYSRKKRNMLVDEQLKPLHGKWSFDADNRLKYPKGKVAPKLSYESSNNYYKEAEAYISKHFSKNYGSIDNEVRYPITHQSADAWLQNFFKQRFKDFGLYEDAIVKTETTLHHSVLTPMLNIGLLQPMDIIQQAISYALEHNITYNTLEGFVRQILGWREFIRMVYANEGVRQRTQNFWGFTRKIPKSFYDGTTGIAPVDDAIIKLKTSGYNHHIERLMILGNFMLLCEIDPDKVHQWFMEMYVDAYDWVMVPNVYGMSQFADGGLMCTKPYISGSNYIFKMSDYKKEGTWPEIWDALFWRFMHVHRDFFLQNPRIGMLVHTFDNMPKEKQLHHLQVAENYLSTLK